MMPKNKIYNNLKQEYLDTYMPKPDADPHGAVDEEYNTATNDPKSNIEKKTENLIA